jgi:hypothetical protein
VAVKILKGLFIGLGWDPARIDDPFELDHPENPSFMAWNYYPGKRPPWPVCAAGANGCSLVTG